MLNNTRKTASTRGLAKIWNTPGGVHPPENKSQSMRLPLADITIPEELIFPLNQHIGTPATPIVEVGEQVLAGQKIAGAVGAVSVPLHASTSGTIVAIEDRVLPHISGMSDRCIILHSDGQHRFTEFTACEDYRSLDSAELLEKIREAGIAGMGGAGFPAAVKLNPHVEEPVHTLIVNGTECEPYITADDCLMQNFADEVVAGTQLLAYILGDLKRVVIGIEDNKPDAIAAVQQSAAGTDVEVATFPTKYPSGGEKQLVQILTGKEIPSGQLPAHVGMLVQNVGTAMAAYRAVTRGEPLTWRIITVVGESLKLQRNVKALLGTPVRHLLNENGFDPQECPRVIMGGPMMGLALPSDQVPVIKTSNCIIAPSHQEMPEPPPAQPCIRCGICAEACPASLLPQQLYWYAKAEDFERLQNHNLFDCIECGACSYVCPSAIPLVQYYRAAKDEIRHQQQEKIKSDHARRRFEFRKIRVQEAEKSKEEKRLARKKAAEAARRMAADKKTASKTETATENSPVADPVAVAMARIKAKENDPVAQESRLTRALSSGQSRVEKLRIRLAQAEDDQSDKLNAQLKQAELRLQDAQEKLAAFLSETAGKSTTDTSVSDQTTHSPSSTPETTGSGTVSEKMEER
ncbi:MAG: electron transport complex protein RnfC [Cellvibrionaceae bacterium]|jgi:electron transport complex protein RnfC